MTIVQQLTLVRDGGHPMRGFVLGMVIGMLVMGSAGWAVHRYNPEVDRQEHAQEFRQRMELQRLELQKLRKDC